MNRIKSILLALCLTCTALAEQRVIIVPVTDGKPIASLQEAIRQGWKVISATPVQDSDSISIGKAKQGYTTCIVFVVSMGT